MIIFQIAIGVILVFIIFRQPYLGIVFTAASLPIVGTLPPIPLLTSIAPLIGGITLAGYFLQRKQERKPLFRLLSVHILGLMFIGWIVITNPQAALFGYDRNWLFTFVQLWILAWLAGELIDTRKKHQVLMWVYSIFTVISALISIQRGIIGSNIDLSLRAHGLVDEPDIAAIYFVNGMLFINYLRTVTHSKFSRLIAIGGLLVIFLGVFYTISRTGILLIFVSLSLLFLINRNAKYRFQLFFISIIGLFSIYYLSENIIGIVSDILPSITRGTDTVGIRYALWDIGWRMWFDHPLTGVGIGEYRFHVNQYAQGIQLIFLRNRNLVAHNMYIQLLADTGLIGFVLFVLMLFKSLQNIRRVIYIDDADIISLRNTWLIVFLAMLLGGLTLSIHYDKMLWLPIGVSVYFNFLVQENAQRNAIYKTAGNIQVRTPRNLMVENDSKI